MTLRPVELYNDDTELALISEHTAPLNLALRLNGRHPIAEKDRLVRHLEYQRALGATNGNARTAVPTHAMGMAFDIALVNTPLATVFEIRDVLREMRGAGLLYFIGETQQLVFHVVPRPAWLGYFEAVHMARLHAPVPPLDAVPVIAELMQREIPPPPAVRLSWWQRMLAA